MIQRSTPFKRQAAWFFILLMYTQLFTPFTSFALTGGPSQPEVQSFEPIGTSEMVDLSSGSFTYNIPLMEVGGYPINLAYHSGSTPDDEASVCGLGWNINPGVINRNMRGLPDDFDGDVVKKEFNIKPNRTWGGSTSAKFELFGLSKKKKPGSTSTPASVNLGVNMGLFYNNYKGVGFEFGILPGFNAGGKSAVASSFGLGITANSQSGVTISPTANFSTSLAAVENGDKYGNITGGLSIGSPVNSRLGLSALTIGHSLGISAGRPYADIEGNLQIESHSRSLYGNSSSFSFATPTYSPSATLPFKSFSFSTNFNVGFEVAGLYPAFGVSGYFSSQKLFKNNLSSPAYGFLYAQNHGNNELSLMDFNREKDGPFTKYTKHLPPVVFTNDIYAVSGQGIAGSYQLKRGDIGVLSDASVVNTSIGGSLGGEIGFGAPPPGVHFGADLVVNASSSRSGSWNDDNAAVGPLAFRSRLANNPNYEPAYFKIAGEKSVETDPNFTKANGGTEPVRVHLENKGITYMNVPAEAKWETEGGTTYPIQAANTKRNRRKRRNQSITYLTADEAKHFALDKKIKNHQINDFTQSPASISLIDRTAAFGNYRQANHLSEITVLRQDGLRYIYGIPAYNTKQEEVSFSVDAQGDCSTGLVNFTSQENSTANKSGDENYYSKTEIPAYAHSYLLTAIVSQDYVDLKLDGPTPDDYGTYTKFNYSQVHDDYAWRIPYESGMANFNEGFKSTERDDKGNYILGTKEYWVLHSVESKTQMAAFHYDTNSRADALSATGQRLHKLDHITLYTLPDQQANGNNAIPIKTVWFKYDYSLCTGIPNSSGGAGKLTLTQLWFTYGISQKGKLSPYKFEYGNYGAFTPFNPQYGLKNYNRWGSYQENKASGTDCYLSPAIATLSTSDYPYVPQDPTQADLNAHAYNLTTITLPSGGVIKVDYEANRYAFTQDRPAMEMTEVFGAGDDLTTPSNGTSLFSNSGPNNILYFKLRKPVDDKADFYNRYLKGAFGDKNFTEGYLYFKFLVQVNSVNSSSPPAYEYVPGYARISHYDVLQKNATTGKYEFGFVKLKEVEVSDFSLPYNLPTPPIPTSWTNPIAKTTWQFTRLHLPKIAYGESDVDENKDDDIAIITKLAKSMGKQVAQFAVGYNHFMKNNQYAQEFVPEKSWIRLCSPERNKIAGGARVKSIRISDGWDKMVPVGTGSSFSYGQEYDYTTVENGDIISSGVAAYEPMVGGDENPFRQPQVFTDKAILAPSNEFYQEEPFGESFFPSPQIVYSKVTVRNLQYINVKRTATGSVAHEFYTARDFPTKTDDTGVRAIPKRTNPIMKQLLFKHKDYMTAAEGFVIELNDMHGKPKAQWGYDESGTRLSGVEYKYKRQGDRLINENIPVIDPNGIINTHAIVGMESSMTTDSREMFSKTVTAGIQLNNDNFLAGVFPLLTVIPLPSYHSEETRFRSMVATKVIQRYGILEKTIAYDLGASVSTENIAWDAETGEVMLTQTVFLQTEIVVERYFNFDPDAQLCPIDFINSSALANTNELEINWTPIPGAEEYDLEWIFVDDYDGNSGFLAPTNLLYDFNQNAARVQIKDNSYRIPLVYEHGYLLYRVRGIGRKSADKFVSPLPGRWSCGDNSCLPNCNTVSGLVGNFANLYPIGMAHENDQKNWQATTTFAEEGKRKTVISYFDGTMRNRQSVTGLNTEQMVMVGETIYDYQGRPAIQVLPAPVNDATLRYYSNFNQNLAGQPYTRNDFDLNDPNCKNDAAPMLPNTSGAANYYSPFNPDKGGFNAYIPNAEGFPFTHTEYTPDNTGRIARQGGVGPVHQLNQSHETKYFYAIAPQEELDQLFGNEVGYAMHYKKNGVLDANGQLSLTYLDAKGNTIATALAGNPPTTLDANGQPVPILEPLASYNATTMTIDLLAHNKKDADNYTLVLEETQIVNTSGDYVFNYEYIPERLDYLDCDSTAYCLDCIYDLEFKIIDNLNCGVVIYQYKQAIGELYIQPAGNISLQCDPPATNPWVTLAPFTVPLEVGSYTFTKMLSVNEAAADAYVAAVLDTCPSLFESILQQQYALMDTSGCNIDCEDAIADQSNSAYYDSLTVDQQKELNDLIVDLCDSLGVSSCEAAYTAMLADVSPGGQYGAIGSPDPLEMNVSVFGTPLPGGFAQILTGNYLDNSVVFLNADGTVFPKTSLADIEQYWRPEWAEQLVKFHPEFCYYQFCDQHMQGSDRYNAQLMNTPDLQSADDANYIGVPTAIMLNDPFFTPVNPVFTSLLPGYENMMVNNILQFKNSGRSMKQLAIEAANYPNPVGSNANWSTNAVIAEKEWVVYRTLYLTYKEELYYKIRTENAIQNNCYNECIGDDNFNPHLNGFSGNSGIGIGTNSQFLNHQRNCDYFGYVHLKKKVKRFPSIYDILPSGFSYDFFNGNQTDIFNYLYNEGGEEKNAICCDSIENEIPDFLFTLFQSNKPNFTLDLTANNAYPDQLEGIFLNGATQLTGTMNYDKTGFYTISFGIDNPCNRLRFKLPKRVKGKITSFCCYVETTTSNYFSSPGVFFQMIATTNKGKTYVVEGIHNEGCQLGCPPKPLPCTDTPAKAEMQAIFNYLSVQQKLHTGTTIIPFGMVGPEITSKFANSTGNFTWTATSVGNSFFANLQRGTDAYIFNFNQPGPVNWPTVKVESMYPDKTKLDAQGKTKDFILPLRKTDGTLIELTGNTEFWVLTDCCMPTEPDTICRPCPPLLDSKVDTTAILGKLDPTDCEFPCDSIPELVWPLINPCVQQQIDIAEHNAHQIYQDSMKQLRTELKADYMEKCLEAAEHFTVTYKDARYHFTLYYYDQANNLVETVPPAGVVPLTTAEIQQVAAHRNGTNIAPVYPAHTLVSRYQFNSLNQLTWQKIPDHKLESLFFYDGLGRLVASINGKQRLKPSGYWMSYTKYDALGRIEEVGENKRPATGGYANFLNDLKTKSRDYTNWENFLSLGANSEITRTEYDQTIPALAAYFPNGKQENLRGRVSVITWKPTAGTPVGPLTSQLLYSYDIHGNVKTLVQRSFELDAKIVEYDYDLVSGKVNGLDYQHRQKDQFYHRYTYDADNRLTEVRTSPDSILWDVDARYGYYKHGPLARVELGDDRVQGLDYAYTLHGWIKGMNSGSLQPQHDMGKDGQNVAPGNAARDAIGYLLGYYDDDYKAIGSNVTFEPGYAGSNLINLNLAPSLYNGNIRNMVTAIEPFMTGQIPMGMAYRYDQLNRLTKATPDNTNFDPSGNQWIGGPPDQRWFNTFTYDPNGNILTQRRNGDNTSALVMDDMTYEYYPNTNQLRKVIDPIPENHYLIDIDNQTAANNYIYDEIGNLKTDVAEKLNIQWNLQGKVSKIIDNAPAQTITFGYNPLGNRIVKTVDGESTYHVYDATGNVLATYRRNSFGQTTLESSWLFGSSRLGEYRAEKCLVGCPRPFELPDHYFRMRGKRRYEESNHLGNVLAVVSDRKMPMAATSGNVGHFVADVVDAQDYYAFGMEMVGRTMGAASRYGFNGKENDDEVKGRGNSLNFGARVYDPRLGRWFSTDPLQKKYSYLTPYNFNSNSPILFIDPDGKDVIHYINVILKDGTQLTVATKRYVNDVLIRHWSEGCGSDGQGGTWPKVYFTDAKITTTIDYRTNTVSTSQIESDYSKKYSSLEVYKRPLVKIAKLDKLIFGGRSSQTDGYHLTSQFASEVDGAKTDSKYDPESVNIDLLMAALGAAGKSSSLPNIKGSLGPAKFLNTIKKIINSSKSTGQGEQKSTTSESDEKDYGNYPDDYILFRYMIKNEYGWSTHGGYIQRKDSIKEAEKVKTIDGEIIKDP